MFVRSLAPKHVLQNRMASSKSEKIRSASSGMSGRLLHLDDLSHIFLFGSHHTHTPIIPQLNKIRLGLWLRTVWSKQTRTWSPAPHLCHGLLVHFQLELFRPSGRHLDFRPPETFWTLNSSLSNTLQVCAIAWLCHPEPDLVQGLPGTQLTLLSAIVKSRSECCTASPARGNQRVHRSTIIAIMGVM